MPETFEVQYDECSVTLCYLDARTGFAIDITPDQARQLAFQLFEKAEDCESLRELEQMQG